jgi:hypothetical protein
MNPQPPINSLTASINSLRPFLSGKYTASFSGFTLIPDFSKQKKSHF